MNQFPPSQERKVLEYGKIQLVNHLEGVEIKPTASDLDDEIGGSWHQMLQLDQIFLNQYIMLL